MDLDRGKPKAVRGRRHALYPTPTDRGLAWVEYSPDGRFAVTGEAGVQHWEAPAQTELRGSTSWPPTIRACGSAASNPTGQPLI